MRLSTRVLKSQCSDGNERRRHLWPQRRTVHRRFRNGLAFIGRTQQVPRKQTSVRAVKEPGLPYWHRVHKVGGRRTFRHRQHYSHFNCSTVRQRTAAQRQQILIQRAKIAIIDVWYDLRQEQEQSSQRIFDENISDGLFFGYSWVEPIKTHAVDQRYEIINVDEVRLTHPNERLQAAGVFWVSTLFDLIRRPNNKPKTFQDIIDTRIIDS